MRLRFAHARSALAFALVVVGCGSTVDETTSGAGGSASSAGGGASDSTGTTSGDTSGSTTTSDGGGSAASTSTTGTGGQDSTACERFCLQAPQCAQDPSDCLNSCLEARPEECGPEFDAIVTCRTPYLAEDCGAEDICPDESAAYSACLQTASPTECFTTGQTSDGACDSTGTCINGQDAEMACDPDGDAYACDCYVGGELLGSCTDAGADCDLHEGCCTQFY